MQGAEEPGPLFLAGSWLRASRGTCSPRLWGPRGARRTPLRPTPNPLDSTPPLLPPHLSPAGTWNPRGGEGNPGWPRKPRPAVPAAGRRMGGDKDLGASPSRRKALASAGQQSSGEMAVPAPVSPAHCSFLHLGPRKQTSLQAARPEQPTADLRALLHLPELREGPLRAEVT